MITLNNEWAHPTNGFKIDPLTLARHLGRVVRFGGAVNTYYTVLQHSLFVSAIASTYVLYDERYKKLNVHRAALYALLHDGHEFLTGDVPTKWKTECAPKQEAIIDSMIYEALGLTCLPSAGMGYLDLIKLADYEALIVEANHISPYTLQVDPEKFRNPELIAKWSKLFREIYCPEPALAFARNWFPDGTYVVDFVKAFEASHYHATVGSKK